MKIATCSEGNNAFDMGECKFGEGDFFSRANHLAARGDSSLIPRGFPQLFRQKGVFHTWLWRQDKIKGIETFSVILSYDCNNAYFLDKS